MPTTNPMVGPGGIRKIVARWVITGELVLESAAHLGSGEEGATVDMALIRDRAEDKPLLSGSSLAGGLRSYIVDRLYGYAKKEPERPGSQRVAKLFGGAREDDIGGQSPLIVFDSICSSQNWISEIRDGVAIHAETGLAEDHKKFDLEVLPSGTTFPIRFELLVANIQKEEDQVSLLATALKGLEKGEIPIGARRSRGLGACRVRNWRVKRFDMTTQEGWRDWLGSNHLHPTKSISLVETIEKAIKSAYSKITLQAQADNRERVQIKVHLVLDAGLLIRSPGTGGADADVTHLFSAEEAILPGTSLAGVLRARALRIARVVRENKHDHEKWIDELFGPRLIGTTNRDFSPQVSRLKITEKPITKSKRLRLNRIKIDRFTGGVVDGALFDEEPVYRGEVEVSLELRNPREGETGLVLLLLKDLLTGDLPVGGTSSVGRGVFKGTATVKIGNKDYTLDPSKPADSATVKVLGHEVQKFHEAKSRSDTASQEETT